MVKHLLQVDGIGSTRGTWGIKFNLTRARQEQTEMGEAEKSPNTKHLQAPWFFAEGSESS